MKKRFILPSAVSLLLVIGLVLTTSDGGGCSYFSPNTLEQVFQSERTICGTGVPFYRSSRQNVPNALLTFIVEEGYVVPLPDDPRGWICTAHWNDSWRDGDSPLHRLLTRDRKRVIAWSRANPDCAKFYWSEGIRLLRSKRKADVSAGDTILILGRRSDDIDELRKTIEKVKREFGVE